MPGARGVGGRLIWRFTVKVAHRSRPGLTVQKPDPPSPPLDPQDSVPSLDPIPRGSLVVQRPPARALRGIPSSRAYWELRADQMMNRIFDPEPTIDVDGRQSHGDGNSPDGAASSTKGSAKSNPEARPQARNQSNRQTLVLFTALGGVCMVSAASTLLYLNHWNQAQESLRQERNLLLVERLRELGPANPAPTPPPHANQLQGGQGSQVATLPDPPLPPPPPEEAWIQELDRLPPTPATQARPLRVPVSPRLASASPAPSLPSPARPPQPAASQGPSPLLVGVVAAPGQAGAAIFQVGSSSSSVSVGESIGSSGWRLRATNGDTAVIERNGETRAVSIGNGE